MIFQFSKLDIQLHFVKMVLNWGYLIFRKLHNGDSKSVLMIKRNSEQIRNYYGFVDYVSVVLLILIILGYILIPEILKKIE